MRIIEGHGPPSPDTYGTSNHLYKDTETGKFYRCHGNINDQRTLPYGPAHKHPGEQYLWTPTECEAADMASGDGGNSAQLDSMIAQHMVGAVVRGACIIEPTSFAANSYTVGSSGQYIKNNTWPNYSVANGQLYEVVLDGVGYICHGNNLGQLGDFNLENYPFFIAATTLWTRTNEDHTIEVYEGALSQIDSLYMPDVFKPIMFKTDRINFSTISEGSEVSVTMNRNVTPEELHKVFYEFTNGITAFVPPIFLRDTTNAGNYQCIGYTMVNSYVTFEFIGDNEDSVARSLINIHMDYKTSGKLTCKKVARYSPA